MILENLLYADDLWMRLWGLIPYKELKEDQGMYFPDCSSIHTFFMSFPIDCYFLNRENQVVDIRKNISPFRFVMGKQFYGCHVMEIASQRKNIFPVEMNDYLEIKENQ